MASRDLSIPRVVDGFVGRNLVRARSMDWRLRPVVRAAKLSLVFASSLGCQVLQQEGGYLVSQTANVHPFVKWYRVLEVLPQDRKKLVAYARSHPCRLWTLKSRGVEVDLDDGAKLSRLQRIPMTSEPSYLQKLVRDNVPSLRWRFKSGWKS